MRDALTRVDVRVVPDRAPVSLGRGRRSEPVSGGRVEDYTFTEPGQPPVALRRIL